jgi:hypothetical protein
MNKKIFTVFERRLRVTYNKRIFIACIPAAAIILIALAVTLFIMLTGIEPIGGSDSIPSIIVRLIFGVCSLALLYAFLVTLIGEIATVMLIKMHKSHSFIQINEKSLVVSAYAERDFLTGKVYKRLWVCDIRDIDDIILGSGTITFKLSSGKTAKAYREPSEWLAMHENESGGLVFDDWTTVSRGTDVRKFTVADIYPLSERIAQRIFLVAGNVREKEARRTRFHQDMLSRARKTPAKRRDRYQPALPKSVLKRR